MHSNTPVKERKNSWSGLLAGAIGGFVGAYAMGQSFGLLLRNVPLISEDNEKEDSTVKTASAISQAIFHRELTDEQKKIAGPIVHYAVGTATGAVYGMLAESVPSLTIGWGLPFGIAIWLGGHVITVPALGLSEPITQSAAAPEAAELTAHVIYGAVTETVRRLLRAQNKPSPLRNL